MKDEWDTGEVSGFEDQAELLFILHPFDFILLFYRSEGITEGDPFSHTEAFCADLGIDGETF